MEPKEIIVFILQILSTLLPSVLLLWRFEVAEKKKTLNEADTERADTAERYQRISAKSTEDLEKEREKNRMLQARNEELEDYIGQLLRVFENRGMVPPAPRRPQK